MFNLKRIFGFIWAAPATIVGIGIVASFSVFGWYKHVGVRGDALIWQLQPHKSPVWLNNRWKGRCGQTCGNVIVVKHNIDTDRGRVTLKHEQEHTRQFMVFGVFQPVLYTLMSLVLYLCRHAHKRYDNPFEIDARRAAGQVVDVIGAVNRAYAEGKFKLPVKK